MKQATPPSSKFRAFNLRTMEELPGFAALSDDERFSIRVVSQVFPFRINSYVASELIDWSRIPDDPIYQLTVPQLGMLRPQSFKRIADLLRKEAPLEKLRETVRSIHAELNPHPAGQATLNVPYLGTERMEGVQHKYRETVLFFPQNGQTCHAYCTFCFRWPQFLTDSEVRFAATDSEPLVRYLELHPEVSDLLITGGDPMVMSTRALERYLEPLLNADNNGLTTIRIGTKSLAYWPYRYVTDSDADDLMRLFERIVVSGKHLAIMAHFNHTRELETPIVRTAIARIRGTGAEIRSQSPLVRHINDVAGVWREMWSTQVNMGIVPYYMFVERNTGAAHYFSVPLARAWEIYRAAMMHVSGLSRTVRGPSMSAAPGKVEIQGVAEVHGEKVFVLRMIQGRNADWVQRPFFAKFDPDATWLNDLQPAFGEREFFYVPEMHARIAAAEAQETVLAREAELREDETSFDTA